MVGDAASAYEAHAQRFLQVRDRSSIGADLLSSWAASLDANGELLELGCGGGFPVSQALVDAGHKLWAVDSSPTLLAEFRSRFPAVEVECASVLTSPCFNRRFDAIVAIGLMFLLNADDQLALIHKTSDMLVPQGRFLFTAPVETGRWAEAITAHPCCSLGYARYTEILARANFRLHGTHYDEGENHYYDVIKITTPSQPE